MQGSPIVGRNFDNGLNVVYRRAEVINAPTPADRVKACVIDTRTISNTHNGAYLHTGKRYLTAIKRLGLSIQRCEVFDQKLLKRSDSV